MLAFRLFRQHSHLDCALRAAAAASGQLRHSSKLSPAKPGTVSGYDQHLFIEADGQTPADWPAAVERSPALLQTFAALAKLKDQITGTVKVTAFSSSDDSGATQQAGTCNAMLFPAGLGFWNMQPRDLEAVVRNFMADARAGEPNIAGQELTGLHLFVCSHGSRDARCGKHGPPLARRLRTLVQAQPKLRDHFQVYECSHVGGHKYAGNVLVYGAISPNDGDWFGGVHAADAEEFLEALMQIDFGSEGGFDHPRLRQWWRGCMGLTKHQQIAAFEAGVLDDRDSGSEDEDSVDIEELNARRR